MKRITFTIMLLSCLNARAQYDITQVVTGLDIPVAFAVTPGGKFLITEKAGFVKAYDANGNFIQTVYDISDSTYDDGECGMLGICLDPQFTANHFVYIYYNHFDSSATATQPRIRVVRFTEVNNTATNPIMLFDEPELGNNHVGGNLHFSSSGSNKLFITIGENTIQPNAQLTDNPYGKILRINSDGTIPTGNPFYDDGDPHTGNDDRIWAYGLRNSFDFTFSALNDSLYATENGPTIDDEVNMIYAGSNYAWPAFTGITNNPAYTDPLFTWTPTQAPTGIIFYTDTVFPQFTNHLLVAVYNNGYIYDLTMGNPPVYDTVVASSIAVNFGAGFANYLTTLHQGGDGCIYALHGGTSGILYRICPLGTGTGDDDVHGLLYDVSPVPAHDHIIVSYLAAAGSKITFKLYDIYGRTVLSAPVTGDGHTNQQSMSVEALPGGVYFLKMEAEGTETFLSQSRKLIITH